jgi:hypothetical protein
LQRNQAPEDRHAPDAARRRIDQLAAEGQQALADLASAKANDDYDTAAVLVERLADIQAAQDKVNAIHRQYVQSQKPTTSAAAAAGRQEAQPFCCVLFRPRAIP